MKILESIGCILHDLKFGKIVKFNDGEYGVRRFSLDGYKFLNGIADRDPPTYEKYNKRPIGRDLDECKTILKEYKKSKFKEREDKVWRSDVGKGMRK